MKLLEIKNLSYTYDDSPVLNDINFVVEKGQWVLLKGPSGSGKSTLLKLIAKLLTPTAGEIRLTSSDSDDANHDNVLWRRNISYAAQMPILFGKTVEGNFQFIYQIRQQAYDVKKVALLFDQLNLSKDLLQHDINDLSGGQRQRIGLARNLLFPGQLLLLDEVTTGLDTETKKAMYQVIQKIREEQNLTIIEISHDPRKHKNIDRVFSLTNKKGLLIK